MLFESGAIHRTGTINELLLCPAIKKFVDQIVVKNIRVTVANHYIN